MMLILADDPTDGDELRVSLLLSEIIATTEIGFELSDASTAVASIAPPAN